MADREDHERNRQAPCNRYDESWDNLRKSFRQDNTATPDEDHRKSTDHLRQSFLG